MKSRATWCAASLLLATMALPASAQPLTIFGSALPVHAVVADPNAVSLGVKFFATVPGTISAVRFYRGHKNANGYTVSLYTAGGSVLASKRVTKDTCAVPCWESVALTSPISINPNTTYVAAYYTSNGEYAGDDNALTDGAGSSPLYAQATGGSLGGNGVYSYSTGFPSQVYENSNYWVDVSFTPSNPTLMLSFNPPAPTVPSSAANGTVVATIVASWSNGSPFTGTLGFAAPYGNDGGLFSISGSNLVVAAPLSVGTANVTIEATQ